MQFIVYIKIDDIYIGIAEDAETRLDTNYEQDRPLPKGKNKKLIGLMKDELRENIIVKFAGLTAKFYSYLMDDGSEDKKANSSEKSVIKRKLKFENYRSSLEVTPLDNKINYLEKYKIDIDSSFCYKRKRKEFIRNNK